MSDSSAVSRLVQRGGLDAREEEEGLCADAGCYGWLRGVRDHAVMLQLCKRGGDVRAIGYAWLECMDYDPSIGITLRYAGQRIEIRGRNLNSESDGCVALYAGLTRHRVPWIREASREHALTVHGAQCVVDSITW